MPWQDPLQLKNRIIGKRKRVGKTVNAFLLPFFSTLRAIFMCSLSAQRRLQQSNSSKAIAAPSAAHRRKIINTQTTLHQHTLQLFPNSMYCLYTKKSAPKNQLSVIIFDSPLFPYPASSLSVILTITADFHTGVLFISHLHKVPSAILGFLSLKINAVFPSKAKTL